MGCVFLRRRAPPPFRSFSAIRFEHTAHVPPNPVNDRLAPPPTQVTQRRQPAALPRAPQAVKEGRTGLQGARNRLATITLPFACRVAFGYKICCGCGTRGMRGGSGLWELSWGIVGMGVVRGIGIERGRYGSCVTTSMYVGGFQSCSNTNKSIGRIP
jgi:hypothetical protein